MLISKLVAAQRQLNSAIRLLFAGEDSVAVHTLAGATSNLYSDLIKHKKTKKSWDRLIQNATNLTQK